MFTVYSPPITYSPPSRSVPPDVAVGRAFQRMWRDASPVNRDALGGAVTMLAGGLRRDGVSPEHAILALKQAIRAHGGVHETPSLAADHHEGGDECVAAYSTTLVMFLDAFFGMNNP